MKQSISMVRALSVVACGLLVVLCVDAEQGKPARRLLKIMHNRTGEERSIELTNVVLYFDYDPIVNPLDSIADAQTGQSFFIPMVEPSCECSKMIDKLNFHDSELYRVRAKCVKTPVPGVKITFFYDPEKVKLVYDLYDSISLQKAVVFRLYDQEMLRALNQMEGRMLRTADLFSSKKKLLLTAATEEQTRVRWESMVFVRRT